ncbi:MAG TPA: hypothetical protein VIG50_15830 [Vicinamibacteria bacterium]
MSQPAGHFRKALAACYFLSFAAIGWLLWQGFDFYRTPLLERAHHEGYWDWKSGGAVGQRLGMIGASMMTLMLLYSVRKRFKSLRKLGPLSRWLDVHIYFGVVGPLLVVLHSSFKVQGLVALSFWSMVLVALSGVAGRYLYLQIPRTRAGDELALAELQRQDRRLADELRTRFRLDDRQIETLDRLGADPAAARAGLLRALAGMLLDDARRRARLRRFARSCRSVPAQVFREFEQVVRDKALARRRILLWDRLHEVFHYWHVLHKPFAIVMYLFMIVHVVVAMVTGYGWIGSS